MRRDHILGRRARRQLAVWFATFALAARLLVPFGFMPASGQPFAIVHCADVGMVAKANEGAHAHHGSAHGQDHDEQKAPGGKHDGPCAFAGVGNAAEIAPVADVAPRPLFASDNQGWPASTTVGIGRGLAAPPPPSTGPPIA